MYWLAQGDIEKQYKPPTILPISNKDSFMIRRKVFRFEYAQPEAGIPGSPMAKSSPKSTPKKAAAPPRRASHRMSLVPAGKTFVPMSPAREMVNGNGGKEDMTEDKLDQEVIDEGQSVVDMVDGEEGDVVYLEVKEGITSKVGLMLVQ